jgi:hypothetical protein
MISLSRWTLYVNVCSYESQEGLRLSVVVLVSISVVIHPIGRHLLSFKMVFHFNLVLLHLVDIVLVRFVSWGEVRLSPLGMSASNWPIVPAPDDRWWVWTSRWSENYQGKEKYSEKTCPSATLSTINPTGPDLRSNPGHSCRKPATNRLSYGTTSRWRKFQCSCVVTISLWYKSSELCGLHPLELKW